MDSSLKLIFGFFIGWLVAVDQWFGAGCLVALLILQSITAEATR